MVRSCLAVPETGAKRPWSKSENVSRDSEGIELTPYGAELFGSAPNACAAVKYFAYVSTHYISISFEMIEPTHKSVRIGRVDPQRFAFRAVRHAFLRGPHSLTLVPCACGCSAAIHSARGQIRSSPGGRSAAAALWANATIECSAAHSLTVGCRCRRRSAWSLQSRSTPTR